MHNGIEEEIQRKEKLPGSLGTPSFSQNSLQK